ncbi:MAG: M48 family metalloprotease [Galactobacter sp.]|uniref:M48 family metalloprotease n=1 Tax=Galactobacter sp. TaxID=2676125 RepID=UPI0025B8284E|nr:M48 family metalloprotease [Galactobacter sp.]
MYSGDGKNRNHSGEGHLVSNIITFVIFFVVLVAGFYATSFTKFGGAWHAWWPMLAVILGSGVIVYGGAMALSRRTENHPDAVANEAHAQDLVDAEYESALKGSKH